MIKTNFPMAVDSSIQILYLEVMGLTYYNSNTIMLNLSSPVSFTLPKKWRTMLPRLLMHQPQNWLISKQSWSRKSKTSTWLSVWAVLKEETSKLWKVEDLFKPFKPKEHQYRIKTIVMISLMIMEIKMETSKGSEAAGPTKLNQSKRSSPKFSQKFKTIWLNSTNRSTTSSRKLSRPSESWATKIVSLTIQKSWKLMSSLKEFIDSLTTKLDKLN